MEINKIFLQAIAEKKLIKVKFNSFEKGIIERVCIPFDFSPSGRSDNKVNKYQVYDLNSPNGSHNLAIFPEQIISIELMEEFFNPAIYVTWGSPYNWSTARDWGIYS